MPLQPKTAFVALLAASAILLIGALIGYQLGSDKTAADTRAQRPAQSSALHSSNGASFEGASDGDPAKPVTFVPGRSERDAAAAKSPDGARTGLIGEDEITAAFRAAAHINPMAALEKVRQIPDARSRDIAMLALLGELSGMTSAEMLRDGNVQRLGPAGALAAYLMDSGKFTPGQTADMAKEFLAGDELRRVLGLAARKLAPLDPATALAFGNQLDGWQQTRFLESFAEGWASADPAAARQWAGQLTDERTRNAIMARILRAEADSNPAIAAQNFVQAAFSNDGDRVRLARQIAASWASKDTIAASQWAETLDETARDGARQGIGSVAPVGIGAVLSTSQDGRPVLQEVIPGAPASTALKAGDAIISVQDANGTWVDSKSVPLWEVTSLIRGTVGSQVSLQVQSPRETAPRTVTFQRQQIIHRPQQ